MLGLGRIRIRADEFADVNWQITRAWHYGEG